MAQSIRSSALRYLKIKPRSVFELGQKLKKKEYSQEEIDAVLKDFIDQGLLNDRAFADAWIRYRLARPFGFGRIIRELKEKGIPVDIIQEAVGKAQLEYEEKDVVLDLAMRKATRMKGLDPQRQRKRIFDFLVRRGFKINECMKVISKLKAT